MKNLTDHAKFQRGIILGVAERFGFDVEDYGDSVNVRAGSSRLDLVIFVLHGKPGLPDDSAGMALMHDGETITVGEGVRRLVDFAEAEGLHLN